MISPVSDNVRALFADLEISAKTADVPVDLVIDRFSQWTDNDNAFCNPSVPTMTDWPGHSAAA